MPISKFVKKLFMSASSSAIGTGTILGLDAAIGPHAPSIQGSEIRDAKVDDSKNLMKFDFDAGSSYFIIVLVILIVLVLVIVIPMYCCGCTPYKLCKKRKEDKFKREILEMIKQRNSKDVEPVERGEMLSIEHNEI